MLVPTALSRRAWLRTAALGAGGALAATLTRPVWTGAFARSAALPSITVYKSPSCGCCAAWGKHLTAAGFTVSEQNVADLAPIKRRFGVPAALESCHTGLVGGYVVEGHVPADVIQQLLRERPAGLGLAVPGMPVGSPGMEGGTPERYDVLLFDAKGKTSVYAKR